MRAVFVGRMHDQYRWKIYRSDGTFLCGYVAVVSYFWAGNRLPNVTIS